MVAKVAWLFRLNIGPVLHMNGRVQELLCRIVDEAAFAVLFLRQCVMRITYIIVEKD